MEDVEKNHRYNNIVKHEIGKTYLTIFDVIFQRHISNFFAKFIKSQ